MPNRLNVDKLGVGFNAMLMFLTIRIIFSVIKKSRIDYRNYIDLDGAGLSYWE
jgi:hypothetical protein